MEKQFPTYREHFDSWGSRADVTPRHNDSDILSKVRDICAQRYYSTSGPDDICFYGYLDGVSHLFAVFQPAQSKDKPEQMSIYESRAKYDAERRLSGKPGKMLRKILPWVSDSECESFANWFKEHFRETNLVVKQVKGPDDIARIYQTPHMPGFDYTCVSGAKVLGRSCMRWETEHFGTPVHPAFVYGAGDFTLLYAESDKGQIASRVMVATHKDKPSAGPIYATNQQSFDVLKSALEDMSADDAGNWNGARLKRVEHGSDCFVMPYLDCIGTIDELDDKFFVVAKGGHIHARETSGYVRFNSFEHYCDSCGDGLSESDVHCGPWAGMGEGCFCESCYNDNFTCWEGETYRNEECAEVYYLARYGRTYEFRPYDGFDDIVYSETNREYWRIDDVTWCESESDWIPNDLIGNGYEICAESGELHPDNEVTEVGGQWYHKDLVGLLSLSNGDIQPFLLSDMEEEAIVKTERKLMAIPVYVLAVNYELDEDGTPVRNPELPLVA